MLFRPDLKDHFHSALCYMTQDMTSWVEHRTAVLYETSGVYCQWSVSDRSELDTSENHARNPLNHKIAVVLSNQPPAVCNYILESDSVVIFYFYPCWYNILDS